MVSIEAGAEQPPHPRSVNAAEGAKVLVRANAVARLERRPPLDRVGVSPARQATASTRGKAGQVAGATLQAPWRFSALGGLSGLAGRLGLGGGCGAIGRLARLLSQAGRP